MRRIVAANPLTTAHRDAIQRANWLRWAFWHWLGSAQHPRGAVLSHYRASRREVSEILRAKRRTLKPEAVEALERLKARVLESVREGATAAITQGRESALVQLDAYRADGLTYTPHMGLVDATVAVLTVAAELDRQAALTLSLLDRGGDVVSEVVGDAHRVGLLTPAPVVATAARALATGMGASFAATVGRERGQDFGWMKQTIPCIDSVTTETCLLAAGQKRKLDERFHLIGEPRFADELDWTPFHWYCRTSVALYQPAFDDGLTDALKADVAKERERRKKDA